MVENNIYVIRVFNRQGKSIIKVGYSENIRERIYTYYTHNPFVEVIMTLYHPDGKNLELSLHKNFKSFILKEWYKENDLQDILDYIKNYSSDEEEVEFKLDKKEKYIILSYEENKKMLKLLSPKEYFFLMKLIEITNEDYLIIGISPDSSARNLSSLLDVSRKEVFNHINTLLRLGVIELKNNKYYLSNYFLRQDN